MRINKDYSKILKITSLLSGVQLFQIIFSVLRVKVVAIFLGPIGMGVFSLLTNTLNTFGSFINLGISTSGVRQISKQNELEADILPVIKVLRALALITGILGVILLFLLAPKVSIALFKNDSYTLNIRILSIVILLIQLTNVNLAILQGSKKLKDLSYANLIGNLLGLIFSLPIIIYFKEAGIPYAIIVTNSFSLITTIFFVNKIGSSINFSIKFDFFLKQSQEILKIGVVLSISGILVNLNSYITQLFITRTGSLSDLGLYTASYSLVVSYVGLILNAMSTEYYPRLCSNASSDNKVNQIVNTQAELLTLLITPIIISFFLFSDLIIRILYTKDFLSIQTLINLMVFGMLFRSASWCISFVFSAKGHIKSFFLIELLATIYSLSFNLIFYYYYGLNGLGYSFILSYVVYLVHVYVIANKKYGFCFSNENKKIFTFCFFFLLILFIVSYINFTILRYFLSILILSYSIVYSFKKIFPGLLDNIFNKC
jgi:O-antigen/teichoic acid export membrane protein